MEFYTLNPPNSQFFSDDVIGSVIQRAGTAKRTLEVSDRLASQVVGSEKANSRSRFPKEKYARGALKCPTPSESEGGAEANRSISATDISRGKTTKLNHEATRRNQDTGVLTAHTRHEVVMELILQKQQYQRNLRRARQRRYRQRKDDHLLQLEEDINQIRHEITVLQQRYQAHSAGVLPENNVWKVSLDYFRVFCCGLQKSTGLVDGVCGPCVQQDFVLTAMSANVMHNTGQGTETLLDNWRHLSRMFGDFRLDLGGLTASVEGSVVATTTTKITITERTIQNVFPHVWDSARDPTSPAASVAGKLIGRRIVLQGSVHFEWDEAYGRVTSVLSRSDFLTPMLHVLGNLGDASRVFENALISADFQLRHVPA
ncbi:hypothetical protein PHYPSEUDO_010217 [Phytophthora pseudosyringae]|uniref:Bzip transcription factor n=1 Tax=Phytophthora pseudosyringae TaxID=221518 RepID=A0A8T1VE35_9STRA|nr:hypothetical protein PHYPSEUDO_010217 [Phytophthora pseudosyringae]